MAMQKEYQRRWYENNREKKIKQTAEKRRQRQEWLRAYKRKLKCFRCIENHPAALDFHHRDPDEKSFGIHRLAVSGRSMAKIEDELAKCDVLCANCHRKKHWVPTDEDAIMGWKSTVTISRKKALELLQSRMLTATNEELAEAVEGMGYGDNTDLEYYGRNFIVRDEGSEDDERAEYERLKEKYG